MRSRGWLVASLLVCAALLLPVAPDLGSGSLAVVTAALVCAATLALGLTLRSALAPQSVAVPVDRRLRGRFLQQSRPGVPGRTRARAPGCGR